MEHDVVFAHFTVPVVDERLVHLLDRPERTSAVLQYVLVEKMRVACEKHLPGILFRELIR